MQGAWGLVLPPSVKSMFSGMKEEVTYENSKNLNAKALTKAFDGGRPTEKDFQIFVQMFPVSAADKEVGIAQFKNGQGDLMAMVGSGEGGLRPGMLAQAYEKRYGEIQVTDEARALASKAEDEEWETFRAE